MRIFNEYNNLKMFGKKKWVGSQIRREDEPGKRAFKNTRPRIVYGFRKSCGQWIRVCRIFFYSTLGIPGKHNKLIISALDNTDATGAPLNLMLGKEKNMKLFEKARNHIFKYHPCPRSGHQSNYIIICAHCK